MTKIYILLFVSFIIIGGCKNNKPVYLNNELGYFDLQNNTIAFTYYKNNIGAIYLYSFNDSTIKKITNPKSGSDGFPHFSNDGMKLFYFYYPNLKEDKICINILDQQTNTIDTLTKGESLIIDACFSNNGKYIYYIKASEFKNYSPIARPMPHGVDLFEIEITTKRQRQITHINAYMMQALTQTYSDTLICVNIPNVEDSMGMGLISISNGRFTKYKFENDPRYQVSSWYFPVSIQKDSLLYTAPYEIYMHNFIDNCSKLILRNPINKDFGRICVDDQWNNLFFQMENDIFKYNIHTKESTKLNINLTR